MAWLALLLPPLFWAGNFIVGRAMRGDMTPMTLSMGRWLIALACLLPFALAPMRRDRALYWQFRWRVLAISAVGVAAFNSLIYLGLRSTTASNGLLLNSLIPLLIVLIGALFYRQHLNRGQVVGLILSFAGVLTLVLQGRWTDWQQVHFVPGDAIVLTAMFSWALYTLWLQQFPARVDRIGFMGVQIILGLLLQLPFYLIERASGLRPHWDAASFAALAYVGIFPSVLAYLFYMRAVHSFGPARAGLSIHLIPVFGVMLSTLFLHEGLQSWQLIGIAAIAAGLICSNLRWRVRRPVTDSSGA